MTNPSPAASESADALLGRRVHYLMWDRKITQTALSRQVGMDQSSLAKKLRGGRGWSLDEVQRIAAALDTTVAYLFGETEDPARPKPHGGPGGLGDGTRSPWVRRMSRLLPDLDSNQEPAGTTPGALPRLWLVTAQPRLRPAAPLWLSEDLHATCMAHLIAA